MPDAHRPCALCGGTAREVLHELAVGTVLRCPGCSLVSMVRPGSTDPVTCDYDDSYFHRDEHGADVGYPDYFGAEADTRSRIAGVLADAVAVLGDRPRTALDVGCGGGYLVGALSRIGVAATGVDPSPYAVGRARLTQPGSFVVGRVDGGEVLRGAPYDVVTVMDVVEHLADPVAVLAAALAVVRPGGRLLVLTPRFAGRLHDRQGADYVHFNVDHVHYFTDGTLRAALRQAGGLGVTCRDVLDLAALPGVRGDAAFTAKYRAERDSILAVARQAG